MIYIPFIYFTLLFVFQYLKIKKFDIVCAIIVIYIVSSLASIILYHQDDNYNRYDISFVSTFAYCIFLSFAIVPFSRFNSTKIKSIHIENEKLFFTISWFFIIVSFLSIITNLEEVKGALSSDLGQLRKSFYDDMYYNTDSNQSIIQYAYNLILPFSSIMLLFFFVSMVNNKGNLIFRILLVISSTTIILKTILTASRTETIYWLIIFYVFSTVFFQLMNNKTKRFFVLLFIFIASLFISYLLLVTVSRFGEGSYAENSIINYVGQPFLNFARLFDIYTFKGITIDRLLPISSKYILGHTDFNLHIYRFYMGQQIGMSINVFYTFLGDAIVDFGRIGMLIYLVVFYCLCIIGLKRNNSNIITLRQLILFTVLIRIPTQGVFAYVYLNINTSFYIIGCLFISYLLKKNKI